MKGLTMNLRAMLTSVGAATLLVAGPGWALANSADLQGDLSGDGAAVVDGSGLSGEGVGSGDVSMTGHFDRPNTPQAPQAPQAPGAPDAPGAPTVSAPGTPQAPPAPETSEVQTPETPPAPEAPERDAASTRPSDGDTRARAEGEGSLKAGIGGDSEPYADPAADGAGEAEHGGQKISVP